MLVARVPINVSPSGTCCAGWKNGTTVAPYSNEYLNTTKKSSTPGDTISYQWAGKQISVFGTLDQPALRGSPNARFSIDGGAHSLFNQTGTVIPATQNVTSHILLYQSPVLNQGAHTISITLIPSSFVGAGAAPSFHFDFFTTVTECVAPFSNVIVDDKDPSVEYLGMWADTNNASDYMQTSRQVANGSATFRFYGKQVSVYGVPPETSTRSLVFEGLGSSVRLRSGSVELPHTRLFYNDSLSDTEEHSLVIRNYLTTSIFSARSARFDYIVYNIGNSAAARVSDSCIPAAAANKTGAIAGGVVGVVLAVLLIVGGFFFFKRRKERLAAKANNEGVAPEVRPAFAPTYHVPPPVTGVDPAQQNLAYNPHVMNYNAPPSPAWTGPQYMASPPSSYAPSSVPQQWTQSVYGAPAPTLAYSAQSDVTTPESGKARFSPTLAASSGEGGIAGSWPQQKKEPLDQDPKDAPPSYADR